MTVAAAARQPAGTLLLRSDRLTPAELADEVLARADLRQVHRRRVVSAILGGSRAYRVLVFSPSGKLIFYRRGYASPTAWTFWHIRATRVGSYHTTYKVKNSSGQWSRYRTVTRSHRC